MQDLKSQIEGIFGASYTGNVVENVKDVTSRLESGEVIISGELEKPQTIEDKEYLISTLKDMISLGIEVLKTLRQDLKLGAPGHVGENFSLVYKSLTESVQRLTELNLKIFDISKSEEAAVETPKNQTNNIIFNGSGRELNEFLEGAIKKVKSTSDLSKIELSKDESGGY